MSTKDDLYQEIDNIKGDIIFLINEVKVLEEKIELINQDYEPSPIPKGTYTSLIEFIKEFEHLSEVNNGS